MDRTDFRHLAIIEAHAQLVRFVQRKQMTSVEAARIAVEHGDALADAMTIEAAEAIRKSSQGDIEYG
jgi:prophage DNA circulation protein